MVSGDFPYLYLGGVGSTGLQVDAGLIWSKQKLAWFPYILVEGQQPIVDEAGPWGSGGIKNQSNVFLRFYVSTNNKVTLYVSGPDQSGTTRSKSYTVDASGFNYDGTNTKMKRLTTIGQPTENLWNGSFFLNSHWFSLKIGNSSAVSNWDSTKTYEPYLVGRVKYPNDSRVDVVTNYFDYDEYVSINLVP